MYELIRFGDYLGTFVFALTGALAAEEKRLDVGGFVLLGFVTGVGGGTLRDLLLQQDGVFWALRPVYILICVVASLIVFFWSSRVRRGQRALIWADAVGIGLFSVIGAGIAVQAEAQPAVAVLMGMLTATGGGVMRDIIRNEVPLVLRREIYVSAAGAGALTFVALAHVGVAPWISISAGMAIGFSLRAVGILFDLHLPTQRH